MSEAEFLIWSLDQREDWATIICLVGGGQETNTNEASIAEWNEELNNKYKKRKDNISDKVTQAAFGS